MDRAVSTVRQLIGGTFRAVRTGPPPSLRRTRVAVRESSCVLPDAPAPWWAWWSRQGPPRCYRGCSDGRTARTPGQVWSAQRGPRSGMCCMTSPRGAGGAAPLLRASRERATPCSAPAGTRCPRPATARARGPRHIARRRPCRCGGGGRAPPGSRPARLRSVLSPRATGTTGVTDLLWLGPALSWWRNNRGGGTGPYRAVGGTGAPRCADGGGRCAVGAGRCR